MAILSLQDDIVTALLPHGAIVGVKDKIYRTPLQLATQLNCPEIFCRLVDHGADKYFQDVRGNLVDIATSHHSIGVIQELLGMENNSGSSDPPGVPSLFERLNCNLRDQVAADARVGSLPVDAVPVDGAEECSRVRKSRIMKILEVLPGA
ncbi:hypothetical protein IFR05_008530 [Cadophora sp. M221]|nr:hypothetical protein IFR05_008530 [Cadophora sp. M221]